MEAEEEIHYIKGFTNKDIDDDGMVLLTRKFKRVFYKNAKAKNGVLEL